MKIQVNREEKRGAYYDPTRWQNSTLRYAPPEDFPAHMAREIGRAALMRVWITLDEYWDYRTDTVYPVMKFLYFKLLFLYIFLSGLPFL